MYINNIKISAFGLIEVMIASIILSISLLGVLALQSKSLYTVVESERKETANQMINQLVNFALTASPNDMPYIAYNNIASANIAECYSTTGCDHPTFYETTVKEWQNILSTLLPNGQGCTCLTNFTSTTTTVQPASLMVAINWRNLSGLLTTIAITTQIPAAIINPATNFSACPTSSTTTPANTTTASPIQICSSNV